MSVESDSDAGVTARSPLEAAKASREARPRLGLNLFWRTFVLLGLLLLVSVTAWLQTFKTVEQEPRAILAAQQIASLVNLSRAALVHSDAIARVTLIKTLADQEAMRIMPREPNDHVELFDRSLLEQHLTTELKARMGSATVVAASVNTEAGLWVGFQIERDSYWLRLNQERLTPLSSNTWLIWLLSGTALSLAGAAVMARLINRPLKDLSYAASRLREGDFESSHLDEHVATSEIREVNIGFNRMADRLAKIEKDRAVMLAGISHDLRTPLARLRLETELSVRDPDAQEHMAADISQLDAIIDKFLDYARPDYVQLKPVSLARVVDTCIFPFKDQEGMRIRLDLPENLAVMADEVELTRIFSNLLENARRYGKTPKTDHITIDIAARVRRPWVMIRVRDHGPGVNAAVLHDLVKPFFRGDAARTSATGAGLGLSIVDKSVRRMGGALVLANSSTGGLSVNLKLRLAGA